MDWFERLLDWVRKLDPLIADGVLAATFAVFGLVSVFNQDRDAGHLTKPGALAVVTALAVCAPVTVRRRAPLPALAVGCIAIAAHEFGSYPEGSLPITMILLTYTVAAWEPTRRALIGLGIVLVTLVAIVFTPGLDLAGFAANVGFFAVGWSVGYAMRSRRDKFAALVREAQERAENERQTTARVLAEERLRIAQELHDVVAHSMSVIAVQAGVGAHVLDAHPEQTRVALDAISATSRGTLNEMRRLLGVLRDNDGGRSHTPAPALADLPHLVDDVRAIGLPVELHVEGA
ncbi:MAG: sensor histidine kinase, partial [Acidimicrobiia bacterium]